MDIERTMQFILDQQAQFQAQFASDVARINSILSNVASAQEQSSERHAKLEEITRTLVERQIRLEETTENVVARQSKIERTMLDFGQSLVMVADAQQRSSEILERSSEILERNSEILERNSQAIESLIERQAASDKARSDIEEAINELVERQKTTEENLNMLILTVERHIADHK
jgi:hypothetical protein